MPSIAPQLWGQQLPSTFYFRAGCQCPQQCTEMTGAEAGLGLATALLPVSMCGGPGSAWTSCPQMPPTFMTTKQEMGAAGTSSDTPLTVSPWPLAHPEGLMAHSWAKN